MHHTELLIFLAGSLSGVILAAFAAAVYTSRKFEEMRNEAETRMSEAARKSYSLGWDEAVKQYGTSNVR